jgi:hypothetical protein
MFALNTGVLSLTESIVGNHSGDAGVFVKISNGNLDADPVTYGNNSYLGKTNYPFVGSNQYPTVSLTVTPAVNTVTTVPVPSFAVFAVSITPHDILGVNGKIGVVFAAIISLLKLILLYFDIQII